MRFENDEYLAVERHHTPDGQQHDITPFFSSRLNALRCLQNYLAMDAAPFSTGVVQQEGLPPTFNKRTAEDTQDLVARHFGRTHFFRLNNSIGTSVLWSGEALHFTETTVPHAQAALMQPTFDAEAFAEIVTRTATAEVQGHLEMASRLIVDRLVIGDH